LKQDRKEAQKDVIKDLRKSVNAEAVKAEVNLETGIFSTEELEAMLNTLPFDITFVDKDDVIRYFSQRKDRIFVRTKAVIGQKIQQCHPQKSVPIVNRILDSFRKGTKDEAEFWRNMQGKLVHTRNFAVKDRSGKYLGCVEVDQDITNIKKIEGEKRVLDWK
jgi:PAS domain S-box-containing protein